jgi:hypothetical protein
MAGVHVAWWDLGSRVLDDRAAEKAWKAMDEQWASLSPSGKRHAWGHLVKKMLGAPSLRQAEWMVRTISPHPFEGTPWGEAMESLARQAADRVGMQGQAEVALLHLMQAPGWTPIGRARVLDRLLHRANQQNLTLFMDGPRSHGTVWARQHAMAWIQQGICPTWEGAGSALRMTAAAEQPLVNAVLDTLVGSTQETWAGVSAWLVSWIPETAKENAEHFLPQRLRQLFERGMPWTLRVSHEWTQQAREVLERMKSPDLLRVPTKQRPGAPWLQLFRLRKPGWGGYQGEERFKVLSRVTEWKPAPVVLAGWGRDAWRAKTLAELQAVQERADLAGALGNIPVTHGRGRVRL